MISAEIIGFKTLRRKLRRIPIENRAGIAKAVTVSLVEVQGSARRLIQRGSRTGVIVKRGKQGRTHQRSAPGEPPKTDTGRLAGSIFTQLDADRLGGIVGTNLVYGKFLEFGTRQMAARPWLFPTFERLKPRITKRIGQAVKDALRQSTR